MRSIRRKVDFRLRSHSLYSKATIDLDVGTVDIASQVLDEHVHDMCYLFRFCEGTGRNPFLVPANKISNLLLKRRWILGNSLLSDFCIGPSLPTQGRPDRPRADAVGSDSLRSPFKSHTARQAEEPSFTSTIGRVLIEGNVTSLACDVNDAARWGLGCSVATSMCVLRGKERPRKCLARECWTVEIDHVMLQAVLWRCLFERTQRNVAGGVNEHRWECCSVLDDGFECFCNRCWIGHIARVCFDVVVFASAHRSVYAIENGLNFVGLERSVQKSKFGALRSQKTSNRRANAAYESDMLVRIYT